VSPIEITVLIATLGLEDHLFLSEMAKISRFFFERPWENDGYFGDFNLVVHNVKLFRSSRRKGLKPPASLLGRITTASHGRKDAKTS